MKLILHIEDVSVGTKDGIEELPKRQSDMYKNKIIPRIEMQVIDGYVAEYPLSDVKQEERGKYCRSESI